MGLNEELGIVFTAESGTHIEARLPITPKLYQPFGFVHGGATIAFMESAVSRGTEINTNLETHLPFGVEIQVRHRKPGKEGTLYVAADLDRSEISERTGNIKQYWNVVVTDDAHEVVSEGTIMCKIVSKEYFARKNASQDC